MLGRKINSWLSKCRSGHENTFLRLMMNMHHAYKFLDIRRTDRVSWGISFALHNNLIPVWIKSHEINA